jgi:hypothetical protein
MSLSDQHRVAADESPTPGWGYFRTPSKLRYRAGDVCPTGCCVSQVREVAHFVPGPRYEFHFAEITHMDALQPVSAFAGWPKDQPPAHLQHRPFKQSHYTATVPVRVVPIIWAYRAVLANRCLALR